MSFWAFVFTYIVGGLTFLPLSLLAVVAAAWYWLPVLEHGPHKKTTDDDHQEPLLPEELGKTAGGHEQKQPLGSLGETAASGTFAVLRQYDFQAAITALNTRNNVSGNSSSSSSNNSGGLNSTAGTDGGPAAEGSTGAAGESVYQSVYRTVFASSRVANSTTSLLQADEDDTDQAPGARRKVVVANLMYIVLRHGHLMFYDSSAQVVVKHVISLAHHNVSLQAARDGDDADERNIPEADLYTKRTAIVLTPVDLPAGLLQQQQQNANKPPKPFYLFCVTSVEKEDFYHALLYTRSRPPIARQLDADALVKLQSALYSSSLTPETRAINALLGRVFLGIHQTDSLVAFFRRKIERKLARIQKPGFIPVVEIRSLDLGDAAPIFSNLKLREFDISGDATVSADMRYTGKVSITLLAVAKLDLGPRFKARTVDLILKSSIQRISGTMLLHIKAAPSNRVWFCFETMPELDIRVEPVVSERKITYGFVLRAIEERVRLAFGEGLVRPNWDDITMPFQDTRGSHARGGIWADAGERDDSRLGSDSARNVAESNEKPKLLPVLSGENTAASSGLSSLSEADLPKLRSSRTLPAEGFRTLVRRTTTGASSVFEVGSSTDRVSLPPKPLRSPSTSSMSPIVAVDGQTVQPVRSDDAALQPVPSPSRTSWRARGKQPVPQPQKDALEGLRDLRDRAEQAAAKSSVVDHGENGSRRRSGSFGAQNDAVDDDSALIGESTESTGSAAQRSVSLRSSNSDGSFEAASISSTRSQQFQQRKANILAVAGAATTAARNWTWNTYQKNRGNFQRGAVRSDRASIPTEPIGRGQPLPPPGVPLPGPNKSIWGSMAGAKRKPVPLLPPRPRTSSAGSGDRCSHLEPAPKEDLEEVPATCEIEDEFGTWHENSGNAETEAFRSSRESNANLRRRQEEETVEASKAPDHKDGAALMLSTPSAALTAAELTTAELTTAESVASSPRSIAPALLRGGRQHKARPPAVGDDHVSGTEDAVSHTRPHVESGQPDASVSTPPKPNRVGRIVSVAKSITRPAQATTDTHEPVFIDHSKRQPNHAVQPPAEPAGELEDDRDSPLTARSSNPFSLSSPPSTHLLPYPTDDRHNHSERYDPALSFPSDRTSNSSGFVAQPVSDLFFSQDPSTLAAVREEEEQNRDLVTPTL